MLDYTARLAALRLEMDREGIAAYVVPSEDPHQSEYPPEHWRQRAWLTGFNGSSGTLVVLRNDAFFWTDGRYHLDATAHFAGSAVTLMAYGRSGIPDVPEWLATNLTPDDVVGICAEVVSIDYWQRLSGTICGAGDCRPSLLPPDGTGLVATADLVGRVWLDRPPLPRSAVYAVDPTLVGIDRAGRLAQVRAALRKSGYGSMVVSALDEICWLFNIRAADVPYNPVAVAYAWVGPEDALLFIDTTRVPPDVVAAFAADSVRVAPYADVFAFVRGVAGPMYLPSDKTNLKLAGAVAADRDGGAATADLRQPAAGRGTPRRPAVSLVSELKAVKTSAEIDSTRRTMVHDAVALVAFARWLESAAGSGVTEYDCGEALARFRAQNTDYCGESFAPIVGYRDHGAVIHYSATPQSAYRVERSGTVLVDCGGQYRGGTTDITRVFALNTEDSAAAGPSQQLIDDFTRVLQGHIRLATAVFPAKTPGIQLDALARDALWRSCADYLHGTGHGVGFWLNVHEGPQRLSANALGVPLVPGMITSNEPGLYRAGHYGVRVENLMLCVSAGSSEFGDFLRFETLTLFPIETSLINARLLTADEREWVNAYHRRVFELVSPHLDADSLDWLKCKTRPIDPPDGFVVMAHSAPTGA